MKRESTEQLRQQVESIDIQQERFGHAHVLPAIAIVLAYVLVNISETLEDIAAGLDCERLRTL